MAISFDVSCGNGIIFIYALSRDVIVKEEIVDARDCLIKKNAEEAVEVYGDFLLAIYDFFVLSFCCPLIWRCSKSRILDLYNTYVSNSHLDIGVGTGYFLNKCQFPSQHPHITLLDLNENCLQRSAKRISHYFPTRVLANIFEPLPLGENKYDSVGLNYLIHCLPGTIQDKGIIFSQIKPFLNPGAVIFGATVLGKDLKLGLVARKLMKLYNNKSIFCNLNDNEPGLRSILEQYFSEVSIKIIGSVAIFSAINA